MSYKLEYFDEVESDLDDAQKWYKTQKEGLEIEFSVAIEIAIRQVLGNPTLYAIRYKKIRIAHPKKFPYNIHFYIDEPNNTVVITAIVHSKRNPKILKKRK